MTSGTVFPISAQTAVTGANAGLRVARLLVALGLMRRTLNLNTFGAGNVCRNPALLGLLVGAFCLFCLSGCIEAQVMPGELASVNGQGISFREAEARRVVLFVPNSPSGENETQSELQAQYRYVVAELIEELLICQFMESNKFFISPEVVQTEERRIRSDYPEGAFEEMLLEEGINLDLWRANLGKHLLVEQFIAQVLRPQITITQEEMQLYYREHSSDFVLSEQWHFIQIFGENKNEVERAQAAFIAAGNAEAVQKEYLVSIHDIFMGYDLLPQELLKELQNLPDLRGSSVREHEGGFRSFVMIEKIPAATLDAGTILQRVEQVIAEEKMRVIYDDWMRNQLEKAEIKLAPPLLENVDDDDVLSALPFADRSNGLSGKTRAPRMNALP